MVMLLFFVFIFSLTNKFIEAGLGQLITLVFGLFRMKQIIC